MKKNGKIIVFYKNNHHLHISIARNVANIVFPIVIPEYVEKNTLDISIHDIILHT